MSDQDQTRRIDDKGGIVFNGGEQQDWGFDCFDNVRLKYWIDVVYLVVCGTYLFAVLLVGLVFDVIGFFIARVMMLLIVFFLNCWEDRHDVLFS